MFYKIILKTGQVKITCHFLNIPHCKFLWCKILHISMLYITFYIGLHCRISGSNTYGILVVEMHFTRYACSLEIFKIVRWYEENVSIVLKRLSIKCDKCFLSYLSTIKFVYGNKHTGVRKFWLDNCIYWRGTT